MKSSGEVLLVPRALVDMSLYPSGTGVTIRGGYRGRSNDGNRCEMSTGVSDPQGMY